jgi:uncharacterized protein (DUF362 family)
MMKKKLIDHKIDYMDRRLFTKLIIGMLVAPRVFFRSRGNYALASGRAPITAAGVGGDKVIDTLNNVVKIQNETATNWNYEDKKYLDYIDYDVVDEMVDEGILKLTGVNRLESAWNIVIRGYKRGDKIAIKPNFNNINHGYDKCFVSPHVINSIIRSLVQYLSVPEKHIFVYDLCKKIPYELIRDRIRYKVNYVERFDFNRFEDKVRVRIGLGLANADKKAPIRMRNDIYDDDENALTVYMPKVVTRADHLINICLLTNHIFVPVSGPQKNHFGTVRFSSRAQYPGALHGYKIKEHIEDINLNEHIVKKTRLYVCDALLGVYARGERKGILKWETYPCNNGTPNTLLFSFDGISMEKVIEEIVMKERKYHNLRIIK